MAEVREGVVMGIIPFVYCGRSAFIAITCYSRLMWQCASRQQHIRAILNIC